MGCGHLNVGHIALRISLALVIVGSQVSGTFVAQYIQHQHFSTGYAVMYFSTSFMFFALSPALLIWYRKKRVPSIRDEFAFVSVEQQQPPQHYWPFLHQLLFLPLPFALLWVCANYAYIFALAHTSSSSALALEQCATVWVFVVSIVWLRDVRVTIWKILAIVCCVGGVVVVSVADRLLQQSQQQEGWLGDVLVIASTVATAAYLVFQKRFLSSLSLRALLLFLAILGCWVCVLLWFPLPILSVTGVEVFAWPAGIGWAWLLLNALLGLSFNVTLNYAVIVASPLLVRLCVAATIPVSFVVDLIIGGAFDGMRLGGALMVLAGFIVYSILETREAVVVVVAVVPEQHLLSTDDVE
jgi:drug/metabolite transporter (DMT)-like permease